MTLVLGHQSQFTIKGIKFDMKFAVSALKLEFHSKTLQLTSNLFPNSTALKQQVIFDLPPLNLTRLSSAALIPLIANKLFEQMTRNLKKKMIFFHKWLKQGLPLSLFKNIWMKVKGKYGRMNKSVEVPYRFIDMFVLYIWHQWFEFWHFREAFYPIPAILLYVPSDIASWHSKKSRWHKKCRNGETWRYSCKSQEYKS